MLDYGYRSKCCLAPIRVGNKKTKKTKQKMLVWVCCSCGTRDCKIITRDEAYAIKNVDHSKLEPEDDKGYNG